MDVWTSCESAAQLFARLSTRPCLDEIESGLFQIKKTKVVEILGEEGSGKTELLLLLIINTITPKKWKGIEIGGNGSIVLFIDTDYKFPFIRFISLIEQRLISKYSTENHSDIEVIETEEFVKSCLTNFYKLNCSSMSQLIATLNSLPSFLSENPDTILILIDNITMYYWSEKLCSKQDSYNNTETFSKLVKDLVDNNNLSVLVTRNQIIGSTNHSYEKFACLPKIGKKRFVVKNEKENRRFIDVATGMSVASFSISSKGVLFN